MKTSHFILLLLICCVSAKTQGQTYELESINGMDTINKTDYNGYKVGKWVLFGKHYPKSGYGIERIIETGNYVNNRKDGVWIEYYKNGKMRSKLTYVNGFLNGVATFYDETEKIRKQGAF